jgi:hypothetical protein
MGGLMDDLDKRTDEIRKEMKEQAEKQKAKEQEIKQKATEDKHKNNPTIL